VRTMPGPPRWRRKNEQLERSELQVQRFGSSAEVSATLEDSSLLFAPSPWLGRALKRHTMVNTNPAQDDPCRVDERVLR
jgi:hypothetical protein